MTSCISNITAAFSPRKPITSATCGRAKNEMLNAEKYSSLAWLSGAAYPATELTEAWKKVLFNQFHDLAAGSGIGVIYQGRAEGLRRGALGHRRGYIQCTAHAGQ